MGRVELKIYDAASGQEKLTVNRWKFQDAMMGERFITFTVTSEKPIEWSVGDYCVYRDETFWLNNIPTITQKAPINVVQDGFTYENVKFDSSQEELTRCMMLDVTPTTPEYEAVLGTNHTGSSRFQLYCGETAFNGRTLTPVCALALKIQANLDRLYPGKWHVYVDTETTYTTSSGKVVLATHTDDKMLSFDNTTVAAALAMVNSEFDLDYTIRFRNIYIGYALNELTADDVGEMFVFGYGKGYPSADNQGKGLFQIKQMANSQQKIVTRLRALGSTKNMPYRYYNKKYGGESNPDLSQSLFPTNLQLPGTFLPEGDRTDAANAKGSTKWARNNARSEYLRAVKGDTNDSFIDKNDDAENCLEGIREDSARWDGSNSQLPEIYPTIEGVTYGELREAGVDDMDGIAGSTSFQGKTVHPDTERIDSLLAVGYTDNGALVDDANVGDGITPEETSYNTTVKPAVIGQTKLEYRPSEHDEDMSFEGDEIELFTINNVSPGKYFMAPTGGSYTSVMFSYRLSSASVSASVGYVIRVKQRVGDSTTLIAEYFSAFSSISGTASHEMALPELPDSKDAPGEQVEDITVTALCDVLVTFAPVVSDMRGGRFSLIYQVGRSIIHPNDDYDPEYKWGPVDGGIAANGSFHVFIKDMGFDLTTTFTGDTPVMAMKSGRCVGREFEIGKNVVPSTVNGVKGYLLTLNRVQDSNLGTYYPSETDPIAAGDYFVLLGISMPDAYIEAAEARLLMAATDYLADNCETKFTYQPSIDDIYLQRQHDNMVKAGTPEKSVYSRLYAGLRFSFKGIPTNSTDPLSRIDIAIQQVTITMGEGLTPKVDIVLNDDVQQSTIQRLTTAVDRIYNGSAYASGGGANLGMLYELLLTEGGKMFLSRINDDTANGKITFNDIITALGLVKAKNGVNVGEFIPGWLGSGASVGSDGRAEFEEVYVRGAIRAAELVFNRIRAEEGEAIRSIGHGEILTVDEESMTATLKLEGDEWATIDSGDICRGLYNTIDKEYTAEDEGEDDNGFRMEKGFFASYFKVEEVLTNGKGECSFRYSLQTDEQGNVITEHPCPLMKFAVYGNTDNSKKERQSSMYITAVGIAPRLLFLAGVNDWRIYPQNIKAALGNLNDLQVYEETDSGEIVLKTLYGDAGLYVEDNIYLGGAIDQFIHATIEDIIGDIDQGHGIHAQLLRGSDNIVVDALGNVVGGIYEEFSDGRDTVNKRYKLHTGVLVYDSGKEQYLKASEAATLADDEYRIYHVCYGCTVLRDGSDFYITGIDNTNDGLSDTVLSDDELETMRKTEQCGINFVIETASGWKTQISYPVKITHLDTAYINFQLNNEFDSISYRSQLSQYDGLPVTTAIEAYVNGERLEDIVSITVDSDLFDDPITIDTDSESTSQTVEHECGLDFTVNLDGSLTITRHSQNGTETDLADAKHQFYITAVAKYAGVSYESGIKTFTLQEITDSTLYKLLLSATAISKDGDIFTPSTIDVKVQVNDINGVNIYTASDFNQRGTTRVRYVNGVYSSSATLLETMPSLTEQTTCITILVVDYKNPSALVVLDTQSVTVNAVGKDGAGQPYVKTNVDSFTIDCDKDGKPLTTPEPLVVDAELYWGDSKCALVVNQCTIKYKGSNQQTTFDSLSESLSASITISPSLALTSSNIEIYLIGSYDGETHTATKTIPVVANRQGNTGNDGDDGRGIVSMITYYKRSVEFSGIISPATDVTPSNEGWYDTRIEPTESEPYLWRFVRTTYTSGTLVEQTDAELIYVWQDVVNPNLLDDTEFLSDDDMDAWYKKGALESSSSGDANSVKDGTPVFATSSTYSSVGYKQYYGKYKALSTNDGSNSGRGYINFLSQYVYKASDSIAKIEAGKWYTLSFYVYGKKGIDGSQDTNVFQLGCSVSSIADTTNGTKVYIDGAAHSSGYFNFELGGNSFTRHTVTFKSMSTLNSDMYILFQMYVREYTQEVWLCKPKLEVGQTATDYRPKRNIDEPVARVTKWEEGKQYYQGKKGEPFLDITAKYNKWYRCSKTHVSKNSNAPVEGSSNDYWEKSNQFSFVATDLLLADQGVIDLLFSQKILMRNAKNQLTASLNYDGEGSYVIYYHETGRKMMQMASDGYWRYFNNDDGNTERWKLGFGGSIEMNNADSWPEVYLAPSSLDVEFNRNDTFTLNEYHTFKSGSSGQWKQWNGYYFDSVPTNTNPATPKGANYLNGIYIASSVVLEELGESVGDNRIYVELLRINNGELKQRIIRYKNNDGTYTNAITSEQI